MNLLFYEQEKKQIEIGLRILANPETPACLKKNDPMKRLLVREHLGIANVPAEEFFETRILPFMKQKHLLVDIGANTGQFAVPMASLGHTVISFEPSPATCEVLLNNLKKANVSSRVELHCAPASSEMATVFFHQDPNVPSTSNKQIFATEAESLRKAGRGGEVSVSQSVTVDSAVGGKKVYLLKTDTQGYEMSVLQGATELLKNGNVKYLLIEFSYTLLYAAKTNPIELLNYVYDHGYMCTYLGFHTVTNMSGGITSYSLVDAPSFGKNELSVSFQKFVESLKVVVAPNALYRKAGWSDLFCWESCSSSK